VTKEDLSKFVKTKKPLDDFSRSVIGLILSVPRGKVVTYGQLAELAGKPHCSRQVGFILRNIVDADRVPWQRVIGAGGRIAFPKRNKNFKRQRQLLESEGVHFDGARLDLERYRWSGRKGSKSRVLPRTYSW
jgi:methylated-DNA-protein-cysteine methyltransferase related protein